MKFWLITGAAGFIGANFVNNLIFNNDDKYIVIDDLTYAGDLSRIENFLNRPDTLFIKANISNRKAIEKIFNDYKIDIIIHFAAESHVDRSILDPNVFIKTNIEGTFNLLDLARKNWTDFSNKLFLHISTDEVFGTLNMDDNPFNEESAYKPNSPYSASKASADLLVYSYYHTYGLPAIITNCSNNYGPWQFPEKLIPLSIVNAIEKREIPVYGDGKQIRDWIHVDDHCNALWHIIKKGRVGDRYCIGGECERTNINIIKEICKIADKILNRSTGETEKLIKYVKDRPGHDRRYAINNAKMYKELCWKPRYNIDIMLEAIFLWYMNNISWVTNVRTGVYKDFYKI